MFGIHNFGLFLGAGILLNLMPGPDTSARASPRHVKIAERTMSILAARPSHPRRRE